MVRLHWTIFDILLKATVEILSIISRSVQKFMLYDSPANCDYKLKSKQFSELIYTELFTVSVILRGPNYCRYYAAISMLIIQATPPCAWRRLDGLSSLDPYKVHLYDKLPMRILDLSP